MSGKVGDNVYRASGVIAAAAAGGGVSWQAVETGATFTAVAGNGYPVNTTAQACTVTLPASASVGDEIIFTDYARKWATNALTINPNSLNYQGNTSPNPIYDTNGESVHIVYQDATKGWIPTYDGSVVMETPQSYTADWVVVAGGGGGGNGYGAGAGGGGYRSSFDSEASGASSPAEPNITLTGGSVYTAVIGAGGVGVSVGTTTNGTAGEDTSLSGTGITTITSIGGGGGMMGTGGDPGQTGGCGGGSQGSGTGGPGTAAQGEDGGASTSGSGYGCSGGGGATVEPPNHPGGGYTSATQGGIDGGDGQTSTIIGSSTVYAGGGGGAGYWWASRGIPGSGGTGGGGDGGDTHNPPVGPAAPNAATDGTANRGGGGGGSGHAGQGGTGVVILRIGDGDYSGTTTGSPTVATDVGGSGDTVITFTGNGTYTA